MTDLLRSLIATAALLSQVSGTAQPWSLDLPNSHGPGPSALPLANGDVLLYSIREEHLLRVDNSGNVVWGAELTGLGAPAAVAEQPNEDLIAVTYLDDPNGSNVAFPSIVRLSATGQLLSGVRYLEDSTWIADWPQVVNADNGDYYVLYTGHNTHRIAFFNANDAMVWTFDFPNAGFAVHATWVPGDGLHCFNGSLHFRLSTAGQLVWANFMLPATGDWGVQSAYWDGTHLVAGILHILSPGRAIPGVAHLDLLGNVLDAITFGGQDSTTQEEMTIAPTTIGHMLVTVDASGHLNLFTCDAQLGNVMAYEAPVVPSWLGGAVGTAQLGMAWMATEGNFFSGMRSAHHIGADGNPGGCMGSINIVLGTLPVVALFPNPMPVTISIPVLNPSGVAATSGPYSPLITPICFTTDVNEQQGLMLNVFPNPARDRILITLPEGPDAMAINLVDARGGIVRQWGRTPAGVRTLQLGTLEAGVYMLRITTADRAPLCTRVVIE